MVSDKNLPVANRIEEWICRMEEIIDRYKLTRWSRMTPQERWDDQNDLNEDYCVSQARIARIAECLGWTRVAEKARQEVLIKRWMIERAARCPNNPANGGDGFDRGDGSWRDRRGSDWMSVEDWLEQMSQR